MQPSLSALTPPVVDHLYNIDGATPSESPVFLFLVGAPGVGKSSGHAYAIESGIIQAGNYATINLDTLLESIEPYRASTAIAHYLGKTPTTSYTSNKENLGAFAWYNSLPPKETEETDSFNRIRAHFLPLKDQVAPQRLVDINDLALARAINRGVDIVYETTLHVSSTGRVKKVDDIMSYIKKRPYRAVFYHITGDPREIAARVHARQEHGMSQNAAPFYRYIPTNPEVIERMARDTAAGFAAVRKRYGKVATFAEFTNLHDPTKLPAPNRRSRSTRRRAIIRAYDPYSLSSKSTSRPSLFVSSPSHRSETRRRRRI